MIELLIQNGSKIYQPAVVEGISLTTERKGTPGKLTFDVVKDASLNFQEGNAVRFTVNGTKMFYGFVFIKKRSKANTISVTAYDQLRYLKNKDTITYERKKASEVIKMLADDFNLQCGTLEDTGYVIESRVEDNQTLFDMIQNALDITLQNTKKLYILYDDCGKLTLKNVESMKLDLLIDAETAEDFDYESSIDNQTYNRVRLFYNNNETGKREVPFEAKDSNNINNWGVLQYSETIQSKTGAMERAKAILSLYDKKTRTLTVKNAFGDPRVHAGCAVVVNLNLGDIITKNYMVVQKVKHTFTESEHLMDLTLIGGKFIA